jgi:hypothetical protein
MKIILTSVVLLLSILSSGQTRRVLFLGNSYTNVNNLPQLTADIANSTADTLLFDSNTPGGYTLQGHSTNTTSLEKIKLGNWDFVVLQEQSQRPALPISQVEVDVFPFAHFLDSVNNAYNPCSKTMFYKTWGRKNGDSYYCPTWPPVCTYAGMDSLLHMRYMMMAANNNAVVSPVGSVWKYIRQHYPAIELYQSDESHPSAEGSFAAACCFYTAIFRKDPSLITYNYTLDPDIADYIRSATKLVVYDSLLNWYIGVYDLSAEFTFAQLNGLTFQFANLSQNASSQLWDFGVATDTSTNPAFTFPEPGVYTVQLFSYNNCDTISTNQLVYVSPTSIAEIPDNENLLFYPNPAEDHIFLNLDINVEAIIEVYNYNGKKMLGFEHVSNKKLNLRSIAPGLYFLKITTVDKCVTVKLVKK